jgi:hypothetical protein
MINKKMKKLFILFIILSTMVMAMGQKAPANHFENLFRSFHSFQSGKKSLKTASATSKQRLDSIIGTSVEKEEFTYDSNGYCTLVSYYEWSSSNSAWVLSMKQELTHDNNGNIASQITYDGLENIKAGVPYQKAECSYNSSGNDTLDSYYSWDSNTSSWYTDGYEKYEYTSDSNGNNILELGYYSKDGSTWTVNDKLKFTYDSNNNCTLLVIYYWNNSSWVPEQEYEYSYNTSYNVDDLIVPDMSFGIQNMLTKISNYTYNSTNSSWTFSGDEICYYSSIVNTTDINSVETTGNLKADIQNGQLQVSGLTIGQNLTVYNMQGIVIYNQQADNTTASVYLPGTGVYIVRSGPQNIKVVRP